MNVTIPKVVVNDPNADELIGTNTALNETVNTEAFSSPKSDLVTSSPHPSLSHARYSDGESNIINVSFHKMTTVNGFNSPNGHLNWILFYEALDQSTSIHRSSADVSEVKCDQKLDTRYGCPIVNNHTGFTE